MRAAPFALLLCAAACHAGYANRGGLEAVAVSADGRAVAVGGQNRVVYLLDAGSLEVTRRFYVGSRVGGLAFSADGKRLAVEDEDDVVRLVDVASGKTLREAKDCRGMAASGDAVAVLDARSLDSAALRILSLADLKTAGTVELAHRPAAWSFADGGKRLVALSLSRAGDEKRVAPADYPPKLTGFARQKFRLENDGLQSLLEVREVADGKAVERSRLWYTSDSDSTVVARRGKTTHVLNRGNLCAKVEGGAAALYATPLFVNHAIGVSPDGSRLVLGGGGEGTWGRPGDAEPTRFALEPLSGQGEWFTRFAVRDDGSAFGVTSAYRAVRIDREGRLAKVAAVY